MNKTQSVLCTRALQLAPWLLICALAAACFGLSQQAFAKAPTSTPATLLVQTADLIAQLDEATQEEAERFSASRESIVEPLALEETRASKVTSISENTPFKETLTGALERTYEFTLDKADLVGIRLSASGTTTDTDGLVGMFTLYEGNEDDDTYFDIINLRQNKTEDCWYYLPAGTYRLLYLQLGTTESRDVSLFWQAAGLDLSPNQVVSPKHRTFDDPAPITTNVQVHGIFFWGFTSTSDDSYLDGHYYEFTLPYDAQVSLVLGTAAPAQIALLDDEGAIAIDTQGTPYAYGGNTNGAVQCGTLKAGTYRFLVISSDPASWKHSFTVEVVTTPTDTTTVFGTSVYRLYNESTGEHLFTTDAHEKDVQVENGWKNEGIAWVAPETSDTPVWRLFNPYSGEHFYSANATEKDSLVQNGWKDEGVAWYSDIARRVAVYRLNNPYGEGIDSHHYTTSANEYQTLASQGWKQEGTGWYGMK